ncbi:MAG TPA: hypothetical protein VJX66_05190, partial [Amycolatopsis sp.]|nr:hypothetical protein [Amycolatopsis sp.]
MSRRRTARTFTIGIAGALAVAGTIVASASAQDARGGEHRLSLTPVPANAKATGLTVPNALSPELA